MIIVGSVGEKLKEKGWGERTSAQTKSYGGLRYSAKNIIRFLPKDFDLFVEPFAGHAYIWQALGKPDNAVLGDINCEAINWIKKRKGKSNPILKCQDWRKTVKETDSSRTLFLLDPPWTRCFKKYRGYSKKWGSEVIERSKKLKGKAVITLNDTEENRNLLCKPPFRCKRIETNFPGCKSKMGDPCKIRIVMGIKDS